MDRRRLIETLMTLAKACEASGFVNVELILIATASVVAEPDNSESLMEHVHQWMLQTTPPQIIEDARQNVLRRN